jgi:hypothetical protein
MNRFTAKTFCSSASNSHAAPDVKKFSQEVRIAAWHFQVTREGARDPYWYDFNSYQAIHSLFKSYNPVMRKITKWQGGAELARKFYLGLEIAIPTLFRHDDRAIYHEIYYNA